MADRKVRGAKKASDAMINNEQCNINQSHCPKMEAPQSIHRRHQSEMGIYERDDRRVASLLFRLFPFVEVTYLQILEHQHQREEALQPDLRLLQVLRSAL